MATFTKQQDGTYLKTEIVQASDLDPVVAQYQKVIDDSNAWILDYQGRIAILQGQISTATQARDSIVALKIAPIVIP